MPPPKPPLPARRASAAGPAWCLRLAGAPALGGPAADAPARPLAPLDGLLLAWLALQGPTPRERLAALLWPTASPTAARNALRQRLFRLRRQHGVALCTEGDPVALAPGIGHDLATEADAPGEAAAQALLLGDWAGPEAGELADWLAQQRRQRRTRRAQRWAQAIDAHEAAGQWDAALPLAEALCALDPLSEDAHRRCMRLHYLRGDRAAALRAFDACEQMLKHEVGARPSELTLQLLQAIEGTPAEGGLLPAARGSQLPASLLRPPRLVGRQAELATLAQAWRTGQVAVLVGEAGMGKSRLLQALAEAQGEPFVASAARPGDALVPYASLARLLRELPQPAPPELRPALAPVLPEFGPSPAAAPRRPSALAPQDALAQWLQALPHLTLLLDDLHFADAASLELLQALWCGPRPARPAPTPGWCLGLRPPSPGSPQAALLQALAASRPAPRIDLEPLDEPTLVELIDSLGVPGLSGARLGKAARQRTGGNPLFLLETLKLLWAQGGGEGAGELPRASSLNQLIAQPLARLSAPALSLARVAAVAGVDFTLPLAEGVLGQTALQLADAWQELEQQRVLQGRAFAHDLMHEAVLAGLPDIIARHLHQQMASWLEAHQGEPARVAAHWEAAGEPERALPALRAAAQRALVALRGHERIRLLLHAADIAEAAGAQDAAFESLSHALDTHMNAVRQASGLPLLDRLDALARTPLQRVRALGQRAWYAVNLNDIATGIAVGQRALQEALALQEPGLLALLRQRLGTALGLQGRFDEALALMEDARPWATEHFPEDQRLEFIGNLAILQDNLGHPEQARAHHEHLLRATVALGDERHRSTALGNYAVSRLNAGDVDGALRLAAQAQDIITRFELDGASSGFIATLLAQCHRALGHYGAALDWCERATELLRNANPAWLPLVQMHQAHVWFDLGQASRARQALAAAQPLPPRHAARRETLWARWCRQQGEDPQPHLQRALADAPATGWPEVGLLARIEAACWHGGPEAPATLLALAGDAAARGLNGAALAARLRACAAATASAPGTAAGLADAALADPAAPSLMHRPELQLICARALHAAGRRADALACARQAHLALQHTAQTQVPPAYRSSFLQRHPVHLALAALAAET